MSSLQLKQIVQYLPNWSAKNNSVWRFLRIPSSNRPYFWPMAKSSLSLSNHSSRFGWSEELLSDTREGSSRYTYVLKIKWHCFCSFTDDDILYADHPNSFDLTLPTVNDLRLLRGQKNFSSGIFYWEYNTLDANTMSFLIYSEVKAILLFLSGTFYDS